MFSVGDRIVYPMHGIGVIDSIESKTVLGDTQDYYTLRFDSGSTSVFVPASAAEKTGMRRPSCENDCREALLRLAVNDETHPNGEETNWNKRYRENLEKLRTGGIFDEVDVIRKLSGREAKRGLSSGEKRMLAESSAMLAGELAEVLGGEPEEYIRQMQK